MEFSHPYSRYGLALVMESNFLKEKEEVTFVQLQEELLKGLGHFRLKPISEFKEKENVAFSYLGYQTIKSNKELQNKGKPDLGIFLCPNIISSDKSAGKTWNGVSNLIIKLQSQKNSNENLTMSLFAASAKFNNGKKSQSTPKASIFEIACAAITNITNEKPCLAFRSTKGGRTERVNTAIIPDLPLNKMIKFIALFKSMRSDALDSLLIGKVYSVKASKNSTKPTIYKPLRPSIYNGNFPNPPQSSALGVLGLLGAIGEWTKKGRFWKDGQDVLESLKSTTLYLVSYGNSKSFSFNHHVIDLAKENKLSRIVDAIYYTKLLGSIRSQDKINYEKFDLFAVRFLQLFNKPAFRDFLAFRAEYPSQLEILFITYFNKMEKINLEIIRSVKELGRWLNYVAYLGAKSENQNTKSEEFKKAKAKILIEIESSTFSAKSGDALIAQVVTRAGRISMTDAPPEASLFIESTCSGELPLDNAKNLLMAFSRLRNHYEAPQKENTETGFDKEDTSEHEE